MSEVYAEARRYFMGEGTLNKTLARLANDLDHRGIDYLVIGGMAMLAHGYRRFTESIDLLITGEGYEKFQGAFDGVSIKIIDELPGASIEIDGIKFVTLEKLIELKLASGISASDRLKDLADVQELIKIKRLDADFALKLDPYVRAKYLELEAAVRNSESSQEK